MILELKPISTNSSKYSKTVGYEWFQKKKKDFNSTPKDLLKKIHEAVCVI